MKDRLIVSCACGNPNHLLVFDYYEDESVDEHGESAYWDEIDVSFTSTYYESFWKRIKIGLKYIFKGKTFVTGDVVCFDHRNIEEFEKMINYLKLRLQKENE
jgi:hypothetical protein